MIASVTALSVSLATALLGASGAAGAAPPPDGPSSGLVAAAQRAKALAAALPADAKLDSDLRGATGPVTALVEYAQPSGVDVAEAGGTPADVRAAAARTEQVAAAVVPAEGAAATARSATAAPTRVATLTNLVAGSIVTGDAAALRALAGSPDVVSVRRLATKHLANSNAVSFTDTLAAWQQTGQTGEDVTIGVIDTGLDYTHADFGGPGTEEAYATAYGEDGTGPVPEGTFDGAKYLGGVDLAGYDYNADPTSDAYQPVPAPDENPIDSPTEVGSGHGTHVAGTAAGYGVLPDGTTFDGDYGTLDAETVADWRVGPGTAPEAGIYAIKVFGDTGGSTDLTALAYDVAADPNGDGDYNDRLDVINLSLGSDYSPLDDVENEIVQTLTDLGTVAVFAAGNAGDTEDAAGTPGNAPAGIAVANSVASPQTFDAMTVVEASDESLVGQHPGQNSIAYTGADVTAPVSFLGADVSGCEPYTPEQAEAVAGTIVYQWWDDDDATRECGSAARAGNAAAAGAAGVLIPTEVPVFVAGISGVAAIPMFQMTAPVTDALLPEIEAGTLVVRIGPEQNASLQADIGQGDLLNAGSSRGVHGSLGFVKPDVAAPGSSILSAASGAGTAASNKSGTSMASPHVAGIAALVRQAHPGWQPYQVKATIVNTATHDLYTELDQQGEVYGPQRVGSGRVDGLDAVRNPVLAYNAAQRDVTSVSFGVIDVGADVVTAERTVTVENTGSTPVTYTTSVSSATTSGGATITATPSRVEVPAGGTAVVTLTMTADPATLEREIDPTMAVEQAGLPREFVSTVSGRLVLTSGDTELRVPVQAAPRLVSDLTAGDVVIEDAADTVGTLPLTGRGVADGGWFSLTTPLVLGATSPKLEDDPDDAQSPSTRAAADIRYVGWASDAPAVAAAGGDPEDAYLGIGVAVDGEWSTIGLYQGDVEAYLDVDQDGTDDLVTYVTKFTETDVTVVATDDLATGENVGLEFLNGLPGDVESGQFDNSVLVLPINLAAAGIEPGQTPSVRVESYTYDVDEPTGLQDVTEPFTVDPYDPPVWFESNIGLPGILASQGFEGAELPVHRRTDVTSADLLVLQHLNADPVSRAQVVSLTAPAATATTTTLTASPKQYAGQDVQLVAKTSPGSGATGTVTFSDGAAVLGTAEVGGGGVAKLTVTLGAGEHALTASFAPDTAAFGASSGTASLTLAKSPATLSASTVRRTVTTGTAPQVKVVLVGRYAAPAGDVTVSLGDGVLGTTALAVDGRRGTATVTLPADLPVGTHVLQVANAGTADLAATTDTVTVVVRPAAAGASRG
ncbi:peptidase S8 [Cellulomonas marina]|nr:peptidase S8 [Cellulomonas marina]